MSGAAPGEVLRQEEIIKKDVLVACFFDGVDSGMMDNYLDPNQFFDRDAFLAACFTFTGTDGELSPEDAVFFLDTMVADFFSHVTRFSDADTTKLLKEILDKAKCATRTKLNLDSVTKVPAAPVAAGRVALIDDPGVRQALVAALPTKGVYAEGAGGHINGALTGAAGRAPDHGQDPGYNAPLAVTTSRAVPPPPNERASAPEDDSSEALVRLTEEQRISLAIAIRAALIPLTYKLADIRTIDRNQLASEIMEILYDGVFGRIFKEALDGSSAGSADDILANVRTIIESDREPVVLAMIDHEIAQQDSQCLETLFTVWRLTEAEEHEGLLAGNVLPRDASDTIVDYVALGRDDVYAVVTDDNVSAAKRELAGGNGGKAGFEDYSAEGILAMAKSIDNPKGRLKELLTALAEDAIVRFQYANNLPEVEAGLLEVSKGTTGRLHDLIDGLVDAISKSRISPNKLKRGRLKDQIAAAFDGFSRGMSPLVGDEHFSNIAGGRKALVTYVNLLRQKLLGKNDKPVNPLQFITPAPVAAAAPVQAVAPAPAVAAEAGGAPVVEEMGIRDLEGLAEAAAGIVPKVGPVPKIPAAKVEIAEAVLPPNAGIPADLAVASAPMAVAPTFGGTPGMASGADSPTVPQRDIAGALPRTRRITPEVVAVAIAAAVAGVAVVAVWPERSHGGTGERAVATATASASARPAASPPPKKTEDVQVAGSAHVKGSDAAPSTTAAEKTTDVASADLDTPEKRVAQANAIRAALTAAFVERVHPGDVSLRNFVDQTFNGRLAQISDKIIDGSLPHANMVEFKAALHAEFLKFIATRLDIIDESDLNKRGLSKNQQPPKGTKPIGEVCNSVTY